MKKIFPLLILIALGGCTTTLQKQTSGSVSIDSDNYSDVFSKVVQSAIDSGLVISTAERENGFILATASHNPFLTNNGPVVNIILVEQPGAVNITIRSTIHGQLVDYGTSRNNIVNFCTALQRHYPKSNCEIST